MNYVEHRNSLIPEAVRYANEIAGSTPAIPDKTSQTVREELTARWAAHWNLVFSRKMTDLCIEAGLMSKQCPTCRQPMPTPSNQKIVRCSSGVSVLAK